MTELIEKVIAALPDKPAMFEDNARASIAAVFDWLAEPSGIAIGAGIYADDSKGACVSDIWTAMLAEMRKQALG